MILSHKFAFHAHSKGVDFFPYKYDLPDGNKACGSGMVFAIDLMTGHNLWQWVHPYMFLNDECFMDCLGDGSTDCYDYAHFDWDWGQCEQAMDGQNSSNFSPEDVKVIYPPKNASGVIWDPNNRRGSMIGPSTINGDLVFIPTMTGEVYVHSVVDGAYIRTIYCPQYQFEYEVEGETRYTPNREGTRSGQTMFDDYLLFYCGAIYVHPTDPEYSDNDLLHKGSMVVMSLSPSLSPTPKPTAETKDDEEQGIIIGEVVGLSLLGIMVIAIIIWAIRRNKSQREYGSVSANDE